MLFSLPPLGISDQLIVDCEHSTSRPPFLQAHAQVYIAVICKLASQRVPEP